MDYEIIVQEEKRAAGLMVRTDNQAPDMQEKIGGLWQKFFEDGIFFQIPGKVNEKSIGLYTNYAGGIHEEYDMYVCCEVAKETVMPENLKRIVIPAGKYARFIVKGNMVTAVQDFWQKLWEMDLDRSFQADYEEYQPGGDMEHAEIHMYLSLK